MHIAIKLENSRFKLICIEKPHGHDAKILFGGASPEAKEHFERVLQEFDRLNLEQFQVTVRHDIFAEYHGNPNGAVEILLNDARGIDEDAAFEEAKSWCGAVVARLVEANLISKSDQKMVNAHTGHVDACEVDKRVPPRG